MFALFLFHWFWQFGSLPAPVGFPCSGDLTWSLIMVWWGAHDISELVFVRSTRVSIIHFPLVSLGLGALWENGTSCRPSLLLMVCLHWSHQSPLVRISANCPLCACLGRHLLSNPRESALCLPVVSPLGSPYTAPLPRLTSLFLKQ